MNKLFSLLKNKVFCNAGWLICGSLLQNIVALIVGLYTARYLGPANYGLINYASAYVTFFFSLATLGINSVLVKKIIDAPDDEGTTLGTALILQVIASLFSIVFITVTVCIIDFGEMLTITVVFLSSLGLLFQEIGNIRYWFQAKLESKYAAIATTVAYIVTSIYKIILLVLGKDVTWFAVATSIDYVCVSIILFVVYKYKRGPKLKFSISTAKDLLKSSYHYILSGLMVSVYNATDRLMLKQMLGEESVGYYGAASTIGTMCGFILAAIIDSMNPVIMELHNSDKRAYIKKNIQMYRIVFYLSLFVSFGITLFADWGVGLLYGEAYQGAVIPLQIITWYVTFSYLGVARNTWIVCENHQKYLSFIYISAAVINVVLNIIMIPPLGAAGAALASLITQISTIYLVPLCIKQLRPNVRMMLESLSFKNLK